MKLTVKKETVIKLFEAMGFKTAKDWNDSRLLRKVKELPELVEEVKIKNPNAKKLLKKLMAAEEVVFAGGGKEKKEKVEPECPSEVAMRKTAKKKPKKKTVTKKKRKVAKKKKTKTKEEPKIEKDAFGSRLGSKQAALNKCLSNKPQSMKELITKAKIKITLYNHLNRLVEKGAVKKNDKCQYFIPKK